ncbi:hypothetical protein VTJ83DRAFT_2801 [Remersonia thermophila]|uniref:Enoyl reductase (ER) domain-containing protein n=1 Tax=Remersonia thermophila TaxID=72144 RepID=A0ABR4DM18_9PEZI
MTKSVSNLAAVLPSPGSALDIQERKIPSPGPGEILIRNRALAINPMDWKRQLYGFAVSSYPAVLGTDLAGVVDQVGPGVTLFQPGDRVLASAAGFLTGNSDQGAFQTYTTVMDALATKVLDKITFSEAATLPAAVSTATIALFDVLGLPISDLENTATSTNPTKTGILVWGGASSTGSAVVQFARLAGLVVFATASPQHHDRVRALGATAVVDYRSPTVVEDLLAAAREAGTPITLALDAISTEETLPLVARVLAESEDGPGSDRKKILATLLPWPDTVARPESVQVLWVAGQRIWKERIDLGRLVFNKLLGKWLETGEVVPAKVQVVDGGLSSLQAGMDEVRKGVSGVKVVVELDE